jgi:tRNA U34 5-carboxymethylaminomethyl modifying GTPase MnmE/TrmE
MLKPEGSTKHQGAELMSAKLPVVSIVGRQNVGKSTLFNALIKDKKSIVDSFPASQGMLYRIP